MLQIHSKCRSVFSRSVQLARRGFLASLTCMLAAAGVNAQTTLLSPSVNNGGFESGTTGWTFAQNTTSTSSSNSWEIGTVPGANSGSNAAYISTGATGLPWGYNNSVYRTSHMYRDIVFPAGESTVTLTFYHKGYGENNWDQLFVSIAPTSVLPVSGVPSANSTAISGATLLWKQSSFPQNSYAMQTVTIPASVVGNANSSTTRRLIFTWSNDDWLGNTPAASIDDITLVSTCTGALPTSVGNMTATSATLNWATVTGSTGYSVRYKAVADPTTVATWATPTPVTGGTTSSVNISMLTANTQYEFQVAAVGSCTPFSPSYQFTTPCASAPLPQFEGFNSASIPSCWNTEIVTPAGFASPPAISYVTSMVNPPGTIPEGSRAAMFNSYNSDNSQIRLISLPITSVGAAGVEVSYLWHHDNHTVYSSSLQEGVQLQYSTDGTNWTNAGPSTPRIASTTGWVSKKQILPPAATNVPTLYIGFLFTSTYGRNCYMDSVLIKALPMCTGTPTPGNTISSVPAACFGTDFTLSLQNNPTGVGGITYQWQSSPNGTTGWTSITGANAPTLTTSQSVATWYRCNVTCGANTGTSLPLQVNMSNYLTCYCTPATTDCTWDDVIDNVTLGSLNNNSSGCPTNGYIDYSSTVAAPLLVRGSTNTVSVSVGNGGTEYVSLWIDYNQNGLFETSEHLAVGSGANTALTNTVSVPLTATLGNTMMRVRVKWNDPLASTDACVGYDYGETEDYLVRIVPQTPSGTNSTQCGTATPTASVSSNTGETNPVFAWYTQATGGTAISGQTGATLNAYPISATTTFYVAEVVDGVESIRKEVVATHNPQPSATISAKTNVTCFGGSNGSATVAPSGGSAYSYSWNTVPVQTTATASGLKAGPYMATVTNSNSTCPTTASVTITEPTAAASIPAITTHPTNKTICSNTGTSFTTAATGLNIGYQWQVNTGSGYTNISNTGVYSGATTATLNITGATVSMNSYLYRAVASGTCSPPATSNAATLTVNESLTGVSVSASATSICPGDNVNFTATPTNGGTTPSYQWKVNGTPVGTNAPAFSSTTLANNDLVTVDLTSNAICPTPATITSAGVEMTVHPMLAPSVSIMSTATTICYGTPVTFTATPVNGGQSPTYQWKVNGVNVGTNSPVFTSSTLNNFSNVICQMTTSEPCPIGSATVNSNTIAMTVNPVVTPAITISASATTVCAGSSVNFTSSVTNGGTTPTYTWKRNGSIVGFGASYATSTLSNNDVITCDLASSVACPTAQVVVSNAITMTVDPILQPLITINSNVGTIICDGESVTFAASILNGGSSPQYQWKVNGNNAGNNGPAFTTSSIANGDIITCQLTTSYSCPTSPTANSNAITMTVNPILVPSLTITPSDSVICVGDLVSFSTTPVNPGSLPSYQWKRNGVDIFGANNSIYSSSSLVNGDQITCVMYSNAVCASTPSVLSNKVTMKVNPLLTPTVSITASSIDTVICTGETVTFTANSTNGGLVPGYQWKLNGVPMQGATAGMFSLNNLNNGDIISCDMTSTATCPVPAMVFSNSIQFTVEATTPPLVFISAAPGAKIKPGEEVTFSAVVLNAGLAPSYQWMKNSEPIIDALDGKYVTKELQDRDTITLMVYSSRVCSDPAFGLSNSVTILYSTGIEQVGNAFADVRLYPNPNSGLFTLEGSLPGKQGETDAKLEILNGIGQLIFKENIRIYNGELKKQIRLTDVANGLYYLRLSSGGHSIIKQLNIQQH